MCPGSSLVLRISKHGIVFGTLMIFLQGTSALKNHQTQNQEPENFISHITSKYQGRFPETPLIRSRSKSPKPCPITSSLSFSNLHIFASWAWAAGESAECVARTLGQVNTSMVYKTYGRCIPNLTRQDGSALEGLLAGAGNKKQPDRRSWSERPNTRLLK